MRKNKQKTDSDIDILLIFKKLPNTRFERVELIEYFLNNLEIKYKIAINPIIKKESEIKMDFFMADIGEYAKILVDKNNKLNRLFKMIKLEYKKI